MATYTGIADGSGNFEIQLGSTGYTSGQNITVTATSADSEKTININAPSSSLDTAGIRIFAKSAADNAYLFSSSSKAICEISEILDLPQAGMSPQSSTSSILSFIDEVILKSPLRSIAGLVFYNSKLTKIQLPNTLQTIGDGAFNASKLIEITIPSGVTSVGSSCFYGCSSLTTVIFESSNLVLGNNLFQNCSALINVTMPSNLETIPNNMFQGCSNLVSIDIPSTVTSIGDRAFTGCTRLTTVNLPNIPVIGTALFSNCSSMKQLTIPSTVTQIKDSSLSMYNLDSLTVLATTPPTMETNSLTGLKAACAIKVPAESVDAYKAAPIWSTRAAYIQAI